MHIIKFYRPDTIPQIAEPYLTLRWEPSNDDTMSKTIAKMMANGREFRIIQADSASASI